MKKLLVTVLVLVISLVVVACGGKGATSGGDEALRADSKDNVITFTANDAKAGSVSVAGTITLKDGETAEIDGRLTSGEVEIEVFKAEGDVPVDKPDEAECIADESVEEGESLQSVDLDPGDYVFFFTVGDDGADGNITVQAVKD